MWIVGEVFEKFLGIIFDGVLKIIAGEMPIEVHLSIGGFDQSRMAMSNAHRDDSRKEIEVPFAGLIEDELSFSSSDVQRFFVLKKRKRKMIGKELSNGFLRSMSNDLKQNDLKLPSSSFCSFTWEDERWRDWNSILVEMIRECSSHADR